MIFRRLILALAAAAILATSAAICIVALAFALYALVEPLVGRAGAAGVVALSAAVLIGLAGMFVALASRRRHRKAPPPPTANLFERTLGFVREKPVVAIGAALGAGFLAIRNPRYLGSALRAFMEGRAAPP